jgi:RecA/RadA recombinase
MSEVNEVRKKLRPKVEVMDDPIDLDKGLSTGCTHLNLACTGRPDVGFVPDLYYVWCGRSGSGKTYLTLTTLAEATLNPLYKKHRLVFDNVENGALMRVKECFGGELARRLEPPNGDRKSPVYSTTLEGFYHNVDNVIRQGEPFVYLLDSMDPLPTEQEVKDFEKAGRKRAKGDDELKGSYGTARAKVNSHNLRLLYRKLKGTNSILIVIFQSRQAIGFGSQYNPDTRGGGLAPTFYCGLELWSSVHKHTYVKWGSKKKVETGVVCKVRVKKGRIQGKDRTALVPILHGAGVDDVGGMISYLVDWEYWSGDEKKDTVVAPEFDHSGPREKLVQYVQENEYEGELSALVCDLWSDVEAKATAKRKKRYP